MPHARRADRPRIAVIAGWCASLGGPAGKGNKGYRAGPQAVQGPTERRLPEGWADGRDLVEPLSTSDSSGFPHAPSRPVMESVEEAEGVSYKRRRPDICSRRCRRARQTHSRPTVPSNVIRCILRCRRTSLRWRHVGTAFPRGSRSPVLACRTDSTRWRRTPDDSALLRDRRRHKLGRPASGRRCERRSGQSRLRAAAGPRRITARPRGKHRIRHSR